jgi:cytoskeletal protein CcmA (bactofilin family)
MTFVIFFVTFLFLLLLPFLLAIKELVHPLDASPLSINMDYSRDPRYFGNSFKGILKRALMPENLSEGTRLITLSKSETVEIVSKTKIPAGDKVDHLMYVMGNLISLEKVTFDKEIYVDGKASIGERNTLRALAAEGKVSLASKTTVIRWVDAEGEFIAARSCDLGWSISSGNRLKIHSDCRFRRLYGMPILSSDEGLEEEISDKDQKCEEIGDAAFISDKDWTIIPPCTKIDKALIFKQNLRIKRNCVLEKDVKTYQKLVLEEGVRIKGNVFAENGITTGSSARIFGNIFSQEAIHLGKGTKIGRAGAIISVVARGKVVLDRGVVIYGYVVAGKRGRVL